jgi:hypothetical protein
MRGTNSTCDACGEVVFGKKGIAWVEKEHITIKGRMSIQMPADQDYLFITKDPETEMHFCDLKCLTDYVTFRRATHLKHREEREKAILRDEAERKRLGL